jgi:membrane protein DedA with SNARE-associated domain
MIVAATFVLEDAASIGAALLATSGIISMPLAIAALTIGIFAGDLGLYGLGRAARSQAWARARIGEAQIERGRRWLRGRLVIALLTARFLPGARLPAYTASGFLEIPFIRFAAITAGAGIVWTAAIFTVATVFGAPILQAVGPSKWLVGVLLLALLILVPRLMRHRHV